jgi:hypothetical protein
MQTRRAFLAALLLAVGVSAAPPLPGTTRPDAAGLPARLTDGQFWRIVEGFSEPGGTFHSDNFVSNEGRFQFVLPDLVGRTRVGQLYVGVGPEQNFTYIAAIRPRMAFIIDIRRGNLHGHLLYKALMEMSADRAEFLGRLFSRERPPGLRAGAPVETLFAAFRGVAPAAPIYRRNLRDVIDWLTKKHRLPLSDKDAAGIDYVYRTAFFTDGPDLGYRLAGHGAFGEHPSYAYLMSMDDGHGRQRSFLASEEHFQFLKELQSKNLIIPVVGDFSGPRALPAIARYARENGAMISAFYVSNVEQYLLKDGKWGAFCATVASMPMDGSSTFIRSRVGRGGPGGPRSRRGIGMFWSGLGSMEEETRACSTGTAAGFLRSF